MARRIALIVLVLAAASVSPARADDDPQCAKYQEPLAYNACLASHGPRATDVGTGPHEVQQSRRPPVQAERNRSAPARSVRGWAHAQRGRGRAHMEFRVH